MSKKPDPAPEPKHVESHCCHCRAPFTIAGAPTVGSCYLCPRCAATMILDEHPEGGLGLRLLTQEDIKRMPSDQYMKLNERKLALLRSRQSEAQLSEGFRKFRDDLLAD